MDVILHLGAHRTASTSFQHYMRANIARLERRGVGFWGPLSARDEILTGHISRGTRESREQQIAEAQAQIVAHLDQIYERGIMHLVVSDENVIGTPYENLHDRQLYGAIGERMARYSQIFGGRISRLVLSIRSQDIYWSSVAALCVKRGQPAICSAAVAALANARRQWRDVITDLACAVPEIEIQVQPYEVFGGMPEQRLMAMTGVTGLPVTHAREKLNRAPSLSELRKILKERGEDPGVLPAGEGRWYPFNRDQIMALREAYADDLFWLRAGADGLATLIDETASAKAGRHPPVDDATRGQADGKENRRLA